jgi:hypothetical protein
MSTSLGFSAFTDMKNIEKMEHIKKKNKTLKHRRKGENFLNSMNNSEGFAIGRRDSSKEPLKSSVSAEAVSDNIGESLDDVYTEKKEGEEEQLQKPQENFGMLKEGMEQQKKYFEEQNQYYNKYVPTYTGTAQNIPYYSDLANSQELTGSKDDLMKKLNYVVHMLEGQHDEKTGHVTEELVLYMFLGVFVIFVVDSFARAGKYTR